MDKIRKTNKTLWFRRDAPKSLTKEKTNLEIYKNILKKLKKNKNYIPDESEIIDKNIERYVFAIYCCDCIPGTITNREFEEYCNQKNAFNEKYIKKGPHKKFINGLTNYLLDDLTSLKKGSTIQQILTVS